MTAPKRTKRAKPDPELVKLADSLLTNYKKPEDLIGETGLLKQLTKMLVERALEAEMAEHLGHDKSQTEPAPSKRTPGSDTFIALWRFPCNTFPVVDTPTISRLRPSCWPCRSAQLKLLGNWTCQSRR